MGERISRAEQKIEEARLREQIGKYALFDELIDMHLDGMCSLDEAVDQFKHDLAVPANK